MRTAPVGIQIEVILKSYKAYRAGDETGDLLLDTGIDEDMGADISHKVLYSGEFGATKGITKGDSADYGQVWYEINTLSLDKVTTHFILPEDGSKTYTAENESLRYIGEQRYYTVVMNVDNDHQEMVIVPESVFYDSELGDILLDDEMSDGQKKDKFNEWGLSGLQFSSADEDKVELSRYLKGVWVIDITSSQIDDIIRHLTVNKTGETPYEDIEVQDQIWTLGLPDELLELTPTITPKLSPLSQLTIVVKEDPIDEWVEKTDNSFVSAVWGWVKEPVTKLVKVTQETFNFIVTFGEAILSGNPGAAMQALEDYGNFVWQGIVSFAQNALEFYAKMNTIFVTLALCALKVWLEYISAIGEWIVEGLNFLMNLISGLINQAINSMIDYLFQPLINANEVYGPDVNDFILAIFTGDLDAVESLYLGGITGIIHLLLSFAQIFLVLVSIVLFIWAIYLAFSALTGGLGSIIVTIIMSVLTTIVATIILEQVMGRAIEFMLDQVKPAVGSFDFMLTVFGAIISFFGMMGLFGKSLGKSLFKNGVYQLNNPFNYKPVTDEAIEPVKKFKDIIGGAMAIGAFIMGALILTYAPDPGTQFFWAIVALGIAAIGGIFAFEGVNQLIKGLALAAIISTWKSFSLTKPVL